MIQTLIQQIYLFQQSKSSTIDLVSRSQLIMERNGNADEAIQLLEQAKSQAPLRYDIRLDLSCAYFYKIAKFYSTKIRKNDDNYSLPPIFSKTWKELNINEQSMLESTLENIHKEIINAENLTKSNSEKAKIFWTRSWIRKLLREKYLCQLCPANYSLLKDNEIEIIDKAISLSPDSLEILRSKADIILVFDIDWTGDYKLPQQPNKDSIEIYESYISRSKFSKTNILRAFEVLSTYYRSTNQSDKLLKLLSYLQKYDSNNSFVFYYLAEQSIEKNTDIVKGTQQNENFIKNARIAARCSSYEPYYYRPSIHATLLPSWILIHEEIYTDFRTPAFHKIFGATLVNGFQNSYNSQLFTNHEFKMECFDLSIRYSSRIIEFFLGKKIKSKINMPTIGSISDIFSSLSYTYEIICEIQPDLKNSTDATLNNYRRRIRNFLLKNSVDEANYFLKNVFFEEEQQ